MNNLNEDLSNYIQLQQDVIDVQHNMLNVLRGTTVDQNALSQLETDLGGLYINYADIDYTAIPSNSTIDMSSSIDFEATIVKNLIDVSKSAIEIAGNALDTSTVELSNETLSVIVGATRENLFVAKPTQPATVESVLDFYRKIGKIYSIEKFIDNKYEVEIAALLKETPTLYRRRGGAGNGGYDNNEHIFVTRISCVVYILQTFFNSRDFEILRTKLNSRMKLTKALCILNYIYYMCRMLRNKNGDFCSEYVHFINIHMFNTASQYEYVMSKNTNITADYVVNVVREYNPNFKYNPYNVPNEKDLQINYTINNTVGYNVLNPIAVDDDSHENRLFLMYPELYVSKYIIELGENEVCVARNLVYYNEITGVGANIDVNVGPLDTDDVDLKYNINNFLIINSCNDKLNLNLTLIKQYVDEEIDKLKHGLSQQLNIKSSIDTSKDDTPIFNSGPYGCKKVNYEFNFLIELLVSIQEGFDFRYYVHDSEQRVILKEAIKLIENIDTVTLYSILINYNFNLGVTENILTNKSPTSSSVVKDYINIV
ncbi:polyADP-ribose glycohydrolase [Malacosoma neustria nucleopolyhedrovirus]|uniref:polyADP-ribose glycohydrolase n=1 Tax=Malacosoma neustria nuclear polyhedrosis virus TaxID=38012 RepID=UPI000E358118|nr:polyADP-ribose glycohydrolase [Malacosoma neustria nucleopolyhedrovirus]AUF81626.1 polyADP-ribose glycohydrolase [Malacosoma neustria nucleopolyhedrovirus]